MAAGSILSGLQSFLHLFAIINYYSIHSGVTSGDVQMNFGRAEQARYKKYIFPIFGDFLRKCYSKSILFFSSHF
jgi:hypothetical protein